MLRAGTSTFRKFSDVKEFLKKRDEETGKIFEGDMILIFSA
jgi:hypothetical protein